MKISFNNMRLHTLIIVLISLIVNAQGFAQLGYSSAALSMGKMGGKMGLLPSPNQVVVEEYFNYHKHVLNYPQKNESVALTISEYVAPDDGLILQVGICTDTVSDLKEIPPVNVCLVIDRSGSMGGDRISKAKEAAVEFVQRLREMDRFSLVLFDDQIEVLIPAAAVDDKARLIELIRGIEVRGSTDLNGGIIKGYSEVLKNYNSNYNNKVIVLTDAITNTGVVDPIQIVQGTNQFKNEHKIDITMVGVGVNFNNDLSRDITTSNRSSIFFINDAEDIKKVFIDEIESLLSPVGKDARIEITLSQDMVIDNCFGYSPSIEGNKLTLDLENMNSGLTQVILIKLKPKQGLDFNRKDGLVKSELRYFDVRNDKNAQVTVASNILKDKSLNEADVQKNYCIARMAQCIKDIAVYCEAENFEEAKYRADFILKSTETFYPKMEDPDVKRVFEILLNYQKVLKEIAPNDSANSDFPY